MLREKEAQSVPLAGTLAPPSASGAFKSPERLRPADERSAAAARAMSPLRETSMLIPGAIVRSGWLWRKGMMNNWKKKWFTIIGSSIYYADTKVRFNVQGYYVVSLLWCACWPPNNRSHQVAVHLH